jgi:hypothetical protein
MITNCILHQHQKELLLSYATALCVQLLLLLICLPTSAHPGPHPANQGHTDALDSRMYRHMAPNRSLHAQAVVRESAVALCCSSPSRSSCSIARSYAPASARKDARPADVMSQRFLLAAWIAGSLHTPCVQHNARSEARSTDHHVRSSQSIMNVYLRIYFCICTLLEVSVARCTLHADAQAVG